MDYVKDKNLILGLINITKQVETLFLWKNPKDRNLILDSINITEQVETLFL